MFESSVGRTSISLKKSKPCKCTFGCCSKLSMCEIVIRPDEGHRSPKWLGGWISASATLAGTNCIRPRSPGRSICVSHAFSSPSNCAHASAHANCAPSAREAALCACAQSGARRRNPRQGEAVTAR